MNFRHTCHVFVDNFSIVYKHLLYGLIVTVIGFGLFSAIVVPAVTNIMGTAQYAALRESLNELWIAIVNLKTEQLEGNLSTVRSAFSDFIGMLGSEKAGLFVLCAVLLAIAYIIYRFLLGIGNYTTGALINDKMTLQAKSPFIGTMIKNLGKASLYNIIYVPITFVYDVLSVVIIWALFFRWLHFLPVLIGIFLFVTVLIALTAAKLAFTVYWLPSLIHGRESNAKAIAHNFKQSWKAFGHTYSNFLVFTLIILALNVAAIFFTFGAGLLITVPASYIMLISYQFVTYYTVNGLKFFVGDEIVGPKKETPPTIEEFFKGEDK